MIKQIFSVIIDKITLFSKVNNWLLRPRLFKFRRIGLFTAEVYCYATLSLLQFANKLVPCPVRRIIYDRSMGHKLDSLLN